MSKFKNLETEFYPLKKQTPIPIVNFAKSVERETEWLPAYCDIDPTNTVLCIRENADQKDTPESVIKAYQQLSVVLAAFTKASTNAGKKQALFDHAYVQEHLLGTGMFYHQLERERAYSHTATDLTVNTAIIKAVLGAAMGGTTILQTLSAVLETCGEQIKIGWAKTKDDQEVGVLLIILKSMMNTPVVSAMHFHAKLKQADESNYSNCHTYNKTKFEFAYTQNNYQFIPPDFLDSMDVKQLQEAQKRWMK